MESLASGYNEVDLERIAKEQVNEDPKSRNVNIESIRQWLQEKQYTKRTDDKFILMFLRSSKFNEKKAMEKIEKWQEIPKYVPNWYKWKDPCDSPFLKIGINIPIAYNTLTGSRVFIIRTGQADPWTMDFDYGNNVSRMITELLLLDHQTQIMGMDIIIDNSDSRLAHARFFTPTVIRAYVKILNASPIRLRGLHIVHVPTFANKLLSLSKCLFSTTLKNRVHFHAGDLTSLHQFIPADSLPDEYGGTAGSLSKYIELCEELVTKNKTFLREISEEE